MNNGTILRLVLSLAISAAICISLPGFVHRPDFGKAFAESQRNPTPATEAASHAQQRETQRIELEIEACGTLLLFVVFNVVWIGVSALNGYIRRARVSKNRVGHSC